VHSVLFLRTADPNHWPNKSDLTEYVWRLGNLTVLSTKLNTAAGRKSFNTKVANYYKKSELKITKEIAKYSQWTTVEVKDRSKKMAKLIAKVFA